MRNVKQGDRISGRSPNRSDRECFRHAAATRVLKLLSGLGLPPENRVRIGYIATLSSVKQRVPAQS